MTNVSLTKSILRGTSDTLTTRLAISSDSFKASGSPSFTLMHRFMSDCTTASVTFNASLAASGGTDMMDLSTKYGGAGGNEYSRYQKLILGDSDKAGFYRSGCECYWKVMDCGLWIGNLWSQSCIHERSDNCLTQCYVIICPPLPG